MSNGAKINQFCDCTEDGWCPRYGKEQRGRFREICRGVNVDLGVAAAFRAQWEMDRPINKVSVRQDGKPIPLLLKTDQAPGDTVCMTAAIYSLHKAYPGRYTTAVESYWPEVFYHNPDVVSLQSEPCYGESILKAQPLHMHYPAIHQCNERGIHFMQGWCEHLGSALGHPVPLLTNRPHLYFPDDLHHNNIDMGNYWVVCSGGKKDFTNKLWGHHNYQEVVSRLEGKVKFVQVGGSKPSVPWSEYTRGSQEDLHQPLDYVHNLVGKTSLRQLFNLVRHARGVLCGVSLLMHVAAALDKPCVVIAGGREPVMWNAYPKQHYLHTVGMLPCKSIQGHIGQACWRSRVYPLGDGTSLDRDTCERPVQLNYAGVPVATIPECMQRIAPESVAALIGSYNDCGG